MSTSQAQMLMDTIRLPEVKLIDSKLDYHNIGSNIDIINVESLAEGSSIDLASLISIATSIYVKQYGALATPAFRGTSSSHTLVLWNGMPINSIANGLADLSGIYCHNFSDISIASGGDGSIFGTGAVGGSLHLNSKMKLDETNKLLISSSMGSFGLSSQSIQFSLKNGKIFTNGGLDYFKHENDFKYYNSTQFGNPLTINENSKIKSNSQNFNLLYNLNTNTNFKLSTWLSKIEREVPQNMTVLVSDAKQYDEFKRLLIAFKHKIDKLSIDFKQAYLEEDFRYTEDLKNINSYYITKSYISDADIKLVRNKYLFNIGSGLINNYINNNNYSSFIKDEKSFSLFSAVQYHSKYFNVNSILRHEWHSTFKVPLIPTVAIESKISQFFKFRLKYNRNFRIPTYNDRFWSSVGAVGNINLNPETSWNKEFGFEIKMKYLNISFTGFKLNILDMIIWQQIDNGIWMPNNIKEVYSRGIETKTNFKFRKLRFDGKYSFTKSTHEVATNNLDNTVGQQLRYVPLHKGSIGVNFVDKDLLFSLRTTYTGEVITSYALPYNKTLNSFFLTDLSIQHKVNSIPISIQLKIKNLTNESYITYQNYPNPGREYLFTIKYIIN